MARWLIESAPVFFSFVADGNTAGTGPGDPWTGSGGGVQPPYSGYAPPHLAQPAYPMHLPHDPMVSDFSSISLSLSLLSTFSSFLTPSIPTTFYSRSNPKKRSITRDSAAGSFGVAVVKTTPLKLLNRHEEIFLLPENSLCRWTCESDQEVDRLKPKRAT